MRTKIWMMALVTVSGLGLSLLAATTVNAEYPPNPTSAALAVDNVTPPTGGSASVAVSVLDASGAPVADVACNFSVVSQPGTDASVDPSSGTTNAQGVATTTLHAGSTPGSIVVTAQCGSAASTISVLAAAQAPAAPPASVPAGPAPQLPASGSGPAATSGGLSTSFSTGLALLLLASGSGAFYLARRSFLRSRR